MFPFCHDTLICVYIYFSLYKKCEELFVDFLHHHSKIECVARVMKEKI